MAVSYGADFDASGNRLAGGRRYNMSFPALVITIPDLTGILCQTIVFGCGASRQLLKSLIAFFFAVKVRKVQNMLRRSKLRSHNPNIYY